MTDHTNSNQHNENGASTPAANSCQTATHPSPPARGSLRTYWTSLPENPPHRGEIVCAVIRHTAYAQPGYKQPEPHDVAYLWRVSAVSRDGLTIRGVERSRNAQGCAVDRLPKQPEALYRISKPSLQRGAADLFDAGLESFNGGIDACRDAIRSAAAERG